MKAIGTYRHIIMGGSELVYANSPYYGKRQRYLPMVCRVMTQIQVIFLGEPIWINVNPNDTD